MTPNPFVALQWMLDGKTVSGIAMRSAAETPSRLEALRLYTQGSAWFSFEENNRGALAVGQLADLAILNRDYLGVPLNQISGIASVLTMVGGRIVYAVGPYAALEEKQR
jgi:predicted amidohydrolase YtcJ